MTVNFPSVTLRKELKTIIEPLHKKKGVTSAFLFQAARDETNLLTSGWCAVLPLQVYLMPWPSPIQPPISIHLGA